MRTNDNGARILIPTIRQEYRNPPAEITVGDRVHTVTFSGNGKYLVSGHDREVRVWQAEDRKQASRMAAQDLRCLAVSMDGKRIAGGTWNGDLFVWDTQTCQRVLWHAGNSDIYSVDFSPDSSRVVSAWSSRTASVWDIASRKQILTLRHEDSVKAAKYSPQGDRIATATRDSVRVYDSNDGRLLQDVQVKVTSDNKGLLWCNDHLFVISDNTIKRIESSTGSTVSEWAVPDSDSASCIVLLQHGEFIAYSSKHTVTFWETSTHTQLSPIQHPQKIQSIAASPDDRFIVIGDEEGKITIKRLTRIVVSIVSRLFVMYLNNSIASFFPGTGHSDRRRYTQSVEARSTRKRRSIIDCSSSRPSKFKPPCIR